MELKVGNIIYSLTGGEPTHKYIIDRVTKTQAIYGYGSGSIKFKIESTGGFVERVGGNGFRVHYKIETPELKEEFERLCLISKLQYNTNFNKLSKSKLELMVKILESEE